MAALILLMTLVGGATRMTESGLSITEWKPVTGVIPPLSDKDWQGEFDRYKQIPQFEKLNPEMTLAGFKSIFWWEWAHRLLARLIGAAFILPGLWFWLSGRFRGGLGLKVAAATGLLALEPIVGWWMVSSGLSERTEVAQERLALHLMIAAATYGALVYAAAGLYEPRGGGAPKSARWTAAALAALIFAQLGLGGLVAGLRAGLVDNTWPLMDGRLVPQDLFALKPWFRAIVDDVTTAQFDHRMLAYVIVAAALANAFWLRRAAPGTLAERTAGLVALAAVAQATLGILTLVFVVPIPLALTHQLTALALFGAAIWHWRATAPTAAGDVEAGACS